MGNGDAKDELEAGGWVIGTLRTRWSMENPRRGHGRWEIEDLRTRWRLENPRRGHGLWEIEDLRTPRTWSKGNEEFEDELEDGRWGI
jgi:hypothetical protein